MFNPFPRLPFRVNKYNLRSIIGQTEYTVVYKSTGALYDYNYAIKVFSYSNIPKENAAAFEAEVNSFIKLDHPNVVHFYDFFKDENYFYLVLEYCDGGTLQQKIRGKDEMPYSEKIFICSQILSALKYCSDKSISHGDIKTSNILFDCNGDIKVSDFGLNRIIKHHEYCNDFGGSLNYNSPEICKNIPYNQYKSDIWSLGVLFYRLFTQCYPFEGRSIHEIKGRIISGFYPERIAGPIGKVVKKMLNVSPDQRPTITQLSKLDIFRSLIGPNKSQPSINHSIPSSTLVVRNMILRPQKRRDSFLSSNLPSFTIIPKVNHISAHNSNSYLT